MRIRSTKPEFWRSKTIGQVDWEARLVLKGMESYVDDNGVGKDDLTIIAADVFPRDLSADPSGTLARLSGALSRLAEANLVVRYVVNGEPLIYIRRWKKIQRIDKPSQGRWPRPDGTMEYRDDVDEGVGAGQSSAGAPGGIEFPPDPRDGHASPPETLAPGTEEQRNRGTEEQGISPGKALSDKSDHALPERFEEFWNAYANKNGRAKSVIAYRRALKKSGVTADLLITAAGEYAAWCTETSTFQKNPLTWLHGEHWNDERAGRESRTGSRLEKNHQVVEQLRAQEQGHTTTPEIGPST